MQRVHSCETCFLREECGGIAQPGGSLSLLGCFEPCAGCVGKPRCTFTCPSRPLEFVQRLSSVGMMMPLSSRQLPIVETTSFPRYVPLIQGGVRFHRPVALDFAALNLAEIFHGDKQRGIPFGGRSLTAESVRREWGLRTDATVLLSGVGKDKHLEKLSANYREIELAKQLAALRVAGVTAPNFTFWKEKPRLHNLWNRRRMLRICENFAEAGVPVIPHINSTHPADWDFWHGYFKEHRELTAVCMEFGTGNRREEVRDRKIAALVDLAGRLGRDLHPVILGGINAASIVGSYFLFYTAIDSTPTMKTIFRQRMLDHEARVPAWRTDPIAAGACMADAFEANYRDHYEGVMRKLVAGGAKRKIPERRPVEDQSETPLEVASPSPGNELPLFYS